MLLNINFKCYITSLNLYFTVIVKFQNQLMLFLSPFTLIHCHTKVFLFTGIMHLRNNSLVLSICYASCTLVLLQSLLLSQHMIR